MKRHPWGNYGLRLGHPIGDTGNYLVVFDEDGAEAHAHLLKIFGGVIPPTFCVRTRRGMYLYFLTPNRYRSARIRPDLDFKASAKTEQIDGDLGSARSAGSPRPFEGASPNVADTTPGDVVNATRAGPRSSALLYARRRTLLHAALVHGAAGL